MRQKDQTRLVQSSSAEHFVRTQCSGSPCPMHKASHCHCKLSAALNQAHLQCRSSLSDRWTKSKELNHSGKRQGTAISTARFPLSCLLLCDLYIRKYLSSFRSRIEMLRKHGNAYNVKNSSRPTLHIPGNFFSLWMQKYPLLQVEAANTVLSILACACNLGITNHSV